MEALTTSRPAVIGTRGPYRPVSVPDSGLLTTNSRVSGRVRTPAWTAEYPCTL